MAYFSSVQFNPNNIQDKLVSFYESLSNKDEHLFYRDHQIIWKLFGDANSKDFLFRKETKDTIEALETAFNTIYYVVSKMKPVDNQNLFYINTKEYNPVIEKGEKFEFYLRANPVKTKAIGGKSGKKCDVLMDVLHAYTPYSNEDVDRVLGLWEVYLKELERKDVVLPADTKEDLFKIIKEFPQRMHDEKKATEKRSLIRKILFPKMESSAKEWLIRQSKLNGFDLNHDEVIMEGSQYHNYTKYNSKSINASQNIKFTSVDYSGVLHVSDVDLFQKALFEGIGRAKRFGCGLLMIRRARR